MTTTQCRAKDPSTCRYHGNEADINDFLGFIQGGAPDVDPADVDASVVTHDQEAFAKVLADNGFQQPPAGFVEAWEEAHELGDVSVYEEQEDFLDHALGGSPVSTRTKQGPYYVLHKKGSPFSLPSSKMKRLAEDAEKTSLATDEDFDDPEAEVYALLEVSSFDDLSKREARRHGAFAGAFEDGNSTQLYFKLKKNDSMRKNFVALNDPEKEEKRAQVERLRAVKSGRLPAWAILPVNDERKKASDALADESLVTAKRWDEADKTSIRASAHLGASPQLIAEVTERFEQGDDQPLLELKQQLERERKGALPPAMSQYLRDKEEASTPEAADRARFADLILSLSKEGKIPAELDASKAAELLRTTNLASSRAKAVEESRKTFAATRDAIALKAELEKKQSQRNILSAYYYSRFPSK